MFVVRFDMNWGTQLKKEKFAGWRRAVHPLTSGVLRVYDEPSSMNPEHAAAMQIESTDQHIEGTRVFRAPGRVNLIGEHTDYNDGFVMPAAINFATTVTVTPRADRRLSVFSENCEEAIEFDLDDPEPRAASHWSDYVRGVAVVLEQSGHRLPGANLRIRGEVPIGSGLSSSAALEVATAHALLANSGHSVPPVELAKLCQRAENEFVGMRCGIMDQFISCCGQADQALMLDCRSLEYKAFAAAGRSTSGYL